MNGNVMFKRVIKRGLNKLLFHIHFILGQESQKTYGTVDSSNPSAVL